MSLINYESEFINLLINLIYFAYLFITTLNNCYPLDEQERIQRKTFVNWINSYLSKRKPPMRVENLIEDLKDGVRIRNHICEDDDDGGGSDDDD